MAKNKQPSIKKGVTATGITGAIFGTTVALTVISQFTGFLLPLLVLVVGGGVSLVSGIALAFAIRSIIKNQKAKNSVKAKNTVKESARVQEVEEEEVEEEVARKEAEVLRQPVKKIEKGPATVLDDYRQDKVSAKTFAIYEADGKTIKHDLNGNRMIYSIEAGDEYKRKLNRFVLSKDSGDCIISVFDENRDETKYDLIGKSYSRGFMKVLDKIEDVAYTQVPTREAELTA